MNLRKIWLIARREYLFNFRRRSFLFTAFGLPLIFAAGMVLVSTVFAQSLQDTSAFKSVGIVDHAGIFTNPSAATIKLPSKFQLIDSEAQAKADLKNNTIDGYYVIPADFLATGRIDAVNRPTLPLNDGVNSLLDQAIKQALGTRLGDPNTAARLQNPFQELQIYRIGNPEPLDQSAIFDVIIVPTMFGVLIFMSIMLTSQFLMSGMAEEKENRMMELFVTSARPSEMLCGKLLGLGALGITQLLVWGAIGLVFAALSGTDVVRSLASLQISTDVLILLVVYFVLGYLLFGAVMSGIGAIVSAEQEGRQIASILSMAGVLPFFGIAFFIENPNGVIPRILSLFPFTSPIAMILRVSWASVAPSEILLSILILAISVVAIIWLAARIFRLGMLSYGKRLGVRDIVRAFREGRQSLVTASQPRGSLS